MKKHENITALIQRLSSNSYPRATLENDYGKSFPFEQAVLSFDNLLNILYQNSETNENNNEESI